jgi:hypothetical protein
MGRFDFSTWLALCGIVTTCWACSADAPAERDASGGAGNAGAPGAGAGSGGSSADPSDSTAPTLRDVQVEIEGPLGATFDIDAGDESFVLASDTTALFTVFARDDTIGAEGPFRELTDALRFAESEVKDGSRRILYEAYDERGRAIGERLVLRAAGA